MTKGDRGSAASVHARLLNGARESGEEFQRVLVRYAIERFLYRLSKSIHAESFVLKGATLLAVWTERPHRATKDVDLLGFGTPDEERLAAVLREVITTSVDADGLEFDEQTVEVVPIREDADYSGLRTTLTVRLGSARIPLQIDTGFGDALTLPAVEVDVPTLLEQPSARLRAYRPEQVIAEKFHAMVDLGLLNTRMKDYFDIYILAGERAFEAADLRRAIEGTFQRRKAAIPGVVPIGLDDAFAADVSKQRQWTAFCQRIGAETVGLEDVLSRIRPFLLEPLEQKPGATWRWAPNGPWTKD